MQEPLWWASNPEWLRELDDWHDLELSNPVPMLEGILTKAYITRRQADRRNELDHRNHHVQSTHTDRADTRTQRPGLRDRQTKRLVD